MVRPFTDPHGWNTVSGVTTPVGRFNGDDVVVVMAGSVPVPDDVVVAIGAVVVVVASGSAEITLSTPATHADASNPNETRSMATLGILASVEEDLVCPLFLVHVM
jgi:hypothetical protein